MAMKYPGLIPVNVNKDAKYSIATRSEPHVVKLIFQVNSGERALLTTDQHQELVDMVDKVKIEHSGTPGGAFYINEFFDVVVPTQGGTAYFAGCYERLLEFDFDGMIVSPRAPIGLSPGDVWPGPHVGAPYTLAGDGYDIRYELRVSPSRTQRARLTDYHNKASVSRLTERLVKVKKKGGRIYINEAGEFFAPVGGEHLYLGPLEDDVWFPAPDVPRP